MKKSKRGYSLIVLIIAIVVILIIASGAITTLNTSMEERKINDFIYDINNIEEAAKQYYSSTGTIPNTGVESNIAVAMTAQLDNNDGKTYYVLDLSKLDLNNIHEMEKEYIINETSLKVYMPEGIEYKGETFYTITDELMGKNTKYQSQNFDVVCTISPTTWTRDVNIRVTIPHISNDFSSWTLKYNIGPKDAEFFQTGGADFRYGETISVSTNGVYTIYINDNAGNEVLKNVVIKNIDDVYPKYSMEDGRLTLRDDETGIKEVRYKTYTDYENNRRQFTRERTELDYYLLDGKGRTIDSLKDDIQAYKEQQAAIMDGIAELDENYAALDSAEREEKLMQYEATRQNFASQLSSLDEKYAYVLDDNTRYVVYVEDYAGNAIAITDAGLTFEKICENFNVYSDAVVASVPDKPSIPEDSIVYNLKVGDYVKYEPDVGTYTPNPTRTGSAENTQQTTNTSVTWRVWENNGTTVKLIPAISVNTLYLGTAGNASQGGAAVANGPAVMNEMCAALYSKAGYTTKVRSMTLEDIQAKLKTPLTPNEGEEIDNYAYYLDSDSSYTSGTITKNGKMYTKTKHTTSFTNNITEPRFYAWDTGEGIEYEANQYKTDSNGTTYLTPTVGHPVYVTSDCITKNIADSNWMEVSDSNASDATTYYKILGSSLTRLASMCAAPASYSVSFCVFDYAGSGVYGYFCFSDSDGYSNGGSYAFRPLVTLKSSVKVDTTDPTKNGSTEANAWILTK